MKKTLVINLIGGPGAGKSTFATNLFATMKQQNISCEYVEEFAKGLVWEGREFALKDQLYLLANQNHNLLRVKGKVNVIITDSPILLSIFYNSQLSSEFKLNENVFESLVLERFNSYDNFVYLIKRNFPYKREGRYQTEEESEKVAFAIQKMLKDKQIKFEQIDTTKKNINNIVKFVKILLKVHKNENKVEKEYERRFLIKNEISKNLPYPKVEIIQNYLDIGQTEKRIRNIDNKHYFFTEKTGIGNSRDEFETEITKSEYTFFKKNYCMGKEIKKTRYFLNLAGTKKCEINIFHQPKYLEIVEVEFNDERQMKLFKKPSWFGKEVTFDKSYNSFNISSK